MSPGNVFTLVFLFVKSLSDPSTQLPANTPSANIFRTGGSLQTCA